MQRQPAAHEKFQNLANSVYRPMQETLRQDPEVKSICSALTNTCELGAGITGVYNPDDTARIKLQYVLWDTLHPEEGVATIIKEIFPGNTVKMLEAGKCEIDRNEYVALLKETVAKRLPIQRLEKEQREKDDLAACTGEYTKLQEQLAKASSDVTSLVPTKWLSAMEKKILADASAEKKFATLAECNSAKAAAQESASQMKQVASHFREGKRNGPAAVQESIAPTAAEIDAK